MARNSKLAAVVVVLSDRETFTLDEQLSLRHLLHYLGRYDKFLVVPNSLRISNSEFRIKRFHNKFFGSVQKHNKLMLSRQFYESFHDYEFILNYHLDSLVFSDQLTDWCEKGFDYIGAPWVKHEDAPFAGLTDFEDKVGNGGFSLRKIESFLKVIDSPVLTIDTRLYWETTYAGKSFYIRALNGPKRVLKGLAMFNGARREMTRYPENEDHFWTNRATHYYPDFAVAPRDVALRFAFECGPRICYEKTNQTLPFGCHAWNKYDREFWEPFLLK